MNGASWDLALLRSKDSSVLHLMVEKPAAAPAPVTAAAPVKRQNSKWDTLKRGLSTLRKDDVAKVPAPSIQWCIHCNARKAETDDNLCSDCKVVARSSSKLATLQLVCSIKNREHMVLVHRDLAWKEARYVLNTVDDSGMFSCNGIPIKDDEGWKKALTFEENGSLRLSWTEK